MRNNELINIFRKAGYVVWSDFRSSGREEKFKDWASDKELIRLAFLKKLYKIFKEDYGPSDVFMVKPYKESEAQQLGLSSTLFRYAKKVKSNNSKDAMPQARMYIVEAKTENRNDPNFYLIGLSLVVHRTDFHEVKKESIFPPFEYYVDVVFGDWNAYQITKNGNKVPVGRAHNW